MTSPSGRQRTAADLLVECLEAEDCRYVFSVPGEETMDILDALSRSNTIRHITTRHEQGAAFMADVHGRLTGRSAVAMATLGPGATNLVTGIADAFLDRAPMVAITGQVGSDKLHKEAHQFVDIVRMFEPVTKWNAAGRTDRRHPRDRAQGVSCRRAREARSDAHRASREPRPDATGIGDRTRPLGRQRTYLSEPPDAAIARAAELIQAAESPLILAGNGVLRRRASDALRTFAEALHIPVAVTFMGKGAIDDRHDLSLMAVGLQARDHVLTGFDRADLVVSVGYDPVEYAPDRWNADRQRTIVHIDTQPAEVDAAYRPAVELIGDISGSLDRLRGLVGPRDARGARAAGPRRPPPGAPPRAGRAVATTRAGRSSPRRRSVTCAALSPRTTSWSATSGRTRSGSRACTRRTSRTP